MSRPFLAVQILTPGGGYFFLRSARYRRLRRRTALITLTITGTAQTGKAKASLRPHFVRAASLPAFSSSLRLRTFDLHLGFILRAASPSHPFLKTVETSGLCLVLLLRCLIAPHLDLFLLPPGSPNRSVLVDAPSNIPDDDSYYCAATAYGEPTER